MEKYKPENFKIEQPENLMPPDWAERLKENPVELIEEKKENTAQELKEKYSNKKA